MGYKREAIKHINRGAAITLAALGALILVMVVGAFGSGWFSDTTAERRGETAQQEGTVASGQYRIARYDAFFDRCQAIVAVEGDIAATKDSAAAGDETQRFYDQQNLRAMQSNRRALIAQYNADAAKEATAGQFRDSNLPARIDAAQETTTCTG